MNGLSAARGPPWSIEPLSVVVAGAPPGLSNLGRGPRPSLSGDSARPQHGGRDSRERWRITAAECLERRAGLRRRALQSYHLRSSYCLCHKDAIPRVPREKLLTPGSAHDPGSQQSLHGACCNFAR